MLKKDESISEDQFKRALSMRIDLFFAQIDEDGNGLITREELHQNVRNSIKGQFSPDKLFMMLDRDNSNEVSREEFKSFFINLCRQQNQSPQKVLSYMDKLIRKFKRQEDVQQEKEKVKLDQKTAFQKIIKIAFKKRLAIESEVVKRLKAEEEKYDQEISMNHIEIADLGGEINNLVNEIQMLHTGEDQQDMALNASSRRRIRRRFTSSRIEAPQESHVKTDAS